MAATCSQSSREIFFCRSRSDESSSAKRNRRSCESDPLQLFLCVWQKSFNASVLLSSALSSPLSLLVSSSPLRFHHISSSSPSAQSPEHTAETREGNSPEHFHTLQTGQSSAVERRINPKNLFFKIKSFKPANLMS